MLVLSDHLWYLATNHEVYHDTKAPDINRWCMALLCQHFRRHIMQTSHQWLVMRAFLTQAWPEIWNLLIRNDWMNWGMRNTMISEVFREQLVHVHTGYAILMYKEYLFWLEVTTYNFAQWRSCKIISICLQSHTACSLAKFPHVFASGLKYRSATTGWEGDSHSGNSVLMSIEVLYWHSPTW